MTSALYSLFYRINGRFPWLLKIPVNLYWLGLRLVNWFRYGDQYFFKWVGIETCSFCNRKCDWCPVSTERDPKSHYMPRETFEKIVFELQGIRFNRWVCLCWYNEPLADARMWELVSWLKIRTKARVHIPTNGDYLDERKADELIRAGVDRLVVSMYPPVKRRVELQAIAAKYPARIYLREFDPDSPLFNRGGSVKVKNLYVQPKCINPIQTINVGWNGDVCLCCNDYHREHVFGNVNKQSLREIWDNPEYRRIRNEVRRGIFRLPVCRRCVGIEK